MSIPVPTDRLSPAPSLPTPTATSTQNPILVVTMEPDFPVLPIGQIAVALDQDGSNIYLLKSDRTFTRLTNSNYNGSPALSPDGKRVAFGSGTLKRDIHIINIDGTGDTILSGIGGNPIWSDDGKNMIWSGTSGQAVIVELIDIAAVENRLELARVTLVEPIPLNTFSISPDHTWLAATLPGTGIASELYLFDLKSQRQIHFRDNARDLAWSPDGKKIAFAMADPNHTNYDVWIANPDGTNQIRLTTDPANDVSPTWSPDSQYIAYQSQRSSVPGLYMIRATGGMAVQLINGRIGRSSWGIDPKP